MNETDETRAGKGFDVGKILLEARTKKGISQADISKSLEKVGIILSQKSYSNLEKNTIGRPNVAVVKALEKILEVKLMQLYYPHSDINETQDDENQRISSSKELNNVLSSLSTKDDNDMIEFRVLDCTGFTLH